MLEDKSKTIGNYYKIWWESSQDPRSSFFEKETEYIISRIPLIQRKSALDIGSGKGKIVSILIDKGFEVTAVEMFDEFCKDLQRRFNNINIINKDIREINFHKSWDLVTIIEVIQNLSLSEVDNLIKKLSCNNKTVILTFPNKNAFSSRWTSLFNFKKSFVTPHDPGQIIRVFEKHGYKIKHIKGNCFLCPVSLFSEFRGLIFPVYFAHLINSALDHVFPKACSFIYIEAQKSSL